MAKYEIMLVVRGDIDENAANKVCDELSSTLSASNLDVKKHGLKELAYEIKKNKHGYYFQLNFDSNESNGIKEFGRIARINKQVLRHLIINLEKDYGYKATLNPKKVARNEKRASIYVKVQEEIKRRTEERLAMLASQENATTEKNENE